MFPFNFIDSSSAIVCAESSVKFKTKTKMNAVSGNAAIFNELLLFARVIFDIVSDNWHLYDHNLCLMLYAQADFYIFLLKFLHCIRIENWAINKSAIKCVWRFCVTFRHNQNKHTHGRLHQDYRSQYNITCHFFFSLFFFFWKYALQLVRQQMLFYCRCHCHCNRSNVNISDRNIK